VKEHIDPKVYGQNYKAKVFVKFFYRPHKHKLSKSILVKNWTSRMFL